MIFYADIFIGYIFIFTFRIVALLPKPTYKSVSLIKKTIPHIFAATLLLLSLISNAQDTITLQKSINLALSNNIVIKNARLGVTFDEYELTQSKNNKLPNLFSNNQTYTYYGRSIDPATNLYANANIIGTNETILSQWIIFQGGLLKNQVTQSLLQIDADKFKSEKIKYDIVFNVIETYLQVLAYQDIVKGYRKQGDLINQTLDKLKANIELGNNKSADIVQLRAQLAYNDLNKIKAENQLELYLLTLKQLTEISSEKEIAVTPPDMSNYGNDNKLYTIDNVYTAAEVSNPDINVAEADKKLAYQAINLAKSKYYPSVVLFGGINTNYSSDIQQLISNNVSFQPVGYLAGNPSQTVLAAVSQPIYGKYAFGAQIKDHLNEAIGVTIQIPIFNRNIAKNSVQKAQVNYEIASNNTLLAKENVKKAITQALSDFKAADKKYAAAQLAYQSSKDVYANVQERYNLGLVGMVDYNTALANIDKAQYELIQAKYEKMFKSKLIDFYSGKGIM